MKANGIHNDETTGRIALPRVLFLPSLILGLAPACGVSEGETPVESAPAEAPAATPADTVADVLSGNAPSAPSAAPRTLDTGYDLTRLAGGEGTPAGATPAPVVEDGVVDTSFAGMQLSEGFTQQFNFGEVPQGEHRTHAFRLQSTGEQPLVLKRIKPSCGCTVAEVRRITEDGQRITYETGEPLPPGSVFEVESSIKTEGRQGKFSSTITLYTNTAEGFLNLHLAATIIPVLAVDGESVVNFGQISSADRAEQTITIRSELLDPFKLSVDESFLTPPIHAEVAPVEPDSEGRSKVWEVTVFLGPKIPEGVRSYPLRLVTDVNGPDLGTGEVKPYDVRVFVQAQVSGLVSASPNFVSFGMVRPGQVVERTSRIVCHDDFVLNPEMDLRLEGLRGDEFPYSDALTVSLEPVEGGQLDLRLQLEGLPEDLNGSFGGLVKVRVDHPLKDELLIRFSGVCRPGVPQRQSTDGGDGQN